MARTRKDLRRLLADLVEWGEKAQRVVEGTARDSIGGTELNRLALERAVEIVGEIAGRLLQDHPEWSARIEDHDLLDAYRTRNRLAHGYDDVSPEQLHDIAREDVAGLTARARLWLAELDADRT